MSNNRYKLEKYGGKNSRHHCPGCGQSNTFTRYIDIETNLYINDNVGRCNREITCGYHYPPREYFKDNPGDKEKAVVKYKVSVPAVPRQEEREPGYIPKDYVSTSLGYKSNFVKFLCSIFDPGLLESPTIERLMCEYYLGCTKGGRVIFWQFDGKRVRTGKMMQYDPVTGKRIKNETGAIDWVHSKLKRDKKLPDDFNLSQCLFGEHLLLRNPRGLVALVESEKTAVIASGYYPEYIWLATGGRSQLSIDKLKVLKGRTIIMFPDTDTTGSTFALWLEKSKALKDIGCSVIVSDLLERTASPEDKEKGIDIADMLLKNLKDRPKVEPFSYTENLLHQFGNLNPDIYKLIETFDLIRTTN